MHRSILVAAASLAILATGCKVVSPSSPGSQPVSATSSAPSGTPSGAPSTAVSRLVGTWDGTNFASTIDIKADGTYSSPNGAQGTYTVEGNDTIVFTGPLAAWNDGRAKFNDEYISFEWTNKEGFYQAFIFGKRK